MSDKVQDWEIFSELNKKIKILDVTINPDTILTNAVNVCVKIRDDNKEIFKKRKIKWLSETFDDGHQLHEAVQRNIRNYIRTEYRPIFMTASIERSLNQYKEQYLKDKK